MHGSKTYNMPTAYSMCNHRTQAMQVPSCVSESSHSFASESKEDAPNDMEDKHRVMCLLWL